MLSEQRIRAVLFYLSLVVFFVGLPFILTFALGYRFDPRNFKFTKSGLIVIKTQPQGAAIFLDGVEFNEKTPATINELLPGRHQIRLELNRHYTWANEVNVDAGKVTYLDRIILFPLKPNAKQLNQERLSSFVVDDKRGIIYYLNPDDSGVYKSDLQGGRSEKVSTFLKISPLPEKLILSDDREKLAYFNPRQLGLAYLKPQNELGVEAANLLLDYPNRKIIDVFWHSDSYHLIVVTNKNIEVLEIAPQASPSILVHLNKKDTAAYYDSSVDALYFLDSVTAADGNLYDNLYKIELSAKLYPLQELMKLKYVEPGAMHNGLRIIKKETKAEKLEIK